MELTMASLIVIMSDEWIIPFFPEEKLIVDYTFRNCNSYNCTSLESNEEPPYGRVYIPAYESS